MSSVLYSVITGFLCGIFSRSVFSFGITEIVWILFLCLALAVIYKRRSQAIASVYLLSTCVFLLAFALGAFRMEMATWGEESANFQSSVGSSIEKDGVIAREPEYRENSTHLYIQSEDELLLVTTDRLHEAHYGDAVRFVGTLKEPEPFEALHGRVFDYEGYLHARGVNYMVSFADVEVYGSGEGNVFITKLLSFKRAFMENIEKALPSLHAGLAEGLLLGVKQALGEDYEKAFVKTGITHIVVLSGYNIMLVTLFVMYVLSFFLPYKLRLLCGITAVALFALLVGLSATVVRASIMAALMLVAKFTGRTYDVIRALLLTAMVMLLLNPYLLVYDVGFQLSFVATAGLILLSSHVEKLFLYMPKTIGLREFLVATVAAQLFVTPILLYQIGEFSVVSIVVNVLVLPMVPVAMLLSFIVGMVGFFSLSLSIVVGYVAYWSLSYILEIAVFFAALPFASFSVPAFPFMLVVCSYTALGFLLVYLQRAPRKKIEKVGALAQWTIVSEQSIVDAKTEKPYDETKPVFFR